MEVGDGENSQEESHEKIKKRQGWKGYSIVAYIASTVLGNIRFTTDWIGVQKRL